MSDKPFISTSSLKAFEELTERQNLTALETELLEALEGLFELYPYDVETKGTGILRGFNGEVQEKVYKARQAIAKAKGEQQ